MTSKAVTASGLLSIWLAVSGVSSLPSPDSANPTLQDGYMSLMNVSTNPLYTYNSTSNNPKITPINPSWVNDCQAGDVRNFCMFFPSSAPVSPAAWQWATFGSCQIGYYWPVGLEVDFADYSAPNNTRPRGYCLQITDVLSENVAIANFVPPPAPIYHTHSVSATTTITSTLPHETSRPTSGPTGIPDPVIVGVFPPPQVSCTTPTPSNVPHPMYNRATNNINILIPNDGGFPNNKTGSTGVSLVANDVSWIIQGVPA